MICLTFKGTLNLVDRLSEDYDVGVQFWSEDLERHIEVATHEVLLSPKTFIYFDKGSTTVHYGTL